MRVEYVNPFVVSALSVFRKSVNVPASQGKLGLKSSPYPSQDVTVVVGITGMVRGQVLFCMKMDTAKSIASAMMLGLAVEEFDEMAKSAVCELANIVTGNASIELSNAGFICDITPPTLLTGHDVSISTVDIRTLVVPIRSELGEVEINIALKEKGS